MNFSSKQSEDTYKHDSALAEAEEKLDSLECIRKGIMVIQRMLLGKKPIEENDGADL